LQKRASPVKFARQRELGQIAGHYDVIGFRRPDRGRQCLQNFRAVLPPAPYPPAQITE
jgi:hypothetical protein